MVSMIDKLHVLKPLKAELFAFGLSMAAAVAVAYVPLEARILTPILVFLSIAASSGLILAWIKAEDAAKAARQAVLDCAVLANRLVRMEQQLKLPAANPALRSTVAEVTGTVGLLGGVVRELARNVAAQHRDVADLKDSLKAPRTIREEEARAAPAAQPDPSLLPQSRKAADDEIKRTRLVMEAFESDRIELHLQPIVALPQRRIRSYETLARLRLMDGTLLGPCEFLPLLERLGRVPEFDRRVLDRAMAVARHLIARGSEAIVGVNLSARSVAEPGFLWTLVGLMDSSPEILGKMVLEFPQECWRGLDSDQKAALATLRDRGVPMSLDGAADLAFDARALADLGVRFMKLPADQLVAAARDEDGRLGPELGVRDFASVLRREGIMLVAEHVEHEEMVPVLIDLGAPLAQGFVFAAPRAVKADVLGVPSREQPALGDAPSPFRRAG